MTSPLVIGLTGGIGCGKSAAADYFRQQGITVIDTDQLAREVVEPGTPAWQAIQQRYGQDVLLDEQTLNRAWLRQRVFANENERQWLEQQTHPRIRALTIERLHQATSPYVILETPLLFETDQHTLVQQTLVVDVEEATQLERACQRDQANEEQIRRIIAAQLPRAERCRLADRVVSNQGSLQQLHLQLDQCHRHYLELSRAQQS